MPAHSGAFVVKDAVVKFGGTSYANQVNKARLVPDTPIQQMRTLVPDGTLTDVDSATWVLELEGIQDWETGGLADYLRDNAGSLVTVIIAPKSGTGLQQATVSARAIYVPFGGSQGEWANFDVELPVQGSPTFAAQA